jgi:CRISPR-associated endonuclease Cas2
VRNKLLPGGNVAVVSKRPFLRQHLRMPKRDLYLLAYDIVDDRRRNRALEACRAFGIDGQFSAHECLFSPAERADIWRRLTTLCDPGKDRLFILRLEPRLETLVLGRPPQPPVTPLLYAG